jgi:eukaryotic-like serine/threonine-protein kinase
MIGETISHYRIVELLGAGGMGVVYRAEDLRLRRTVALKFLPIEATQDRDARERLLLEAQTASALDHPNICTIHEIDETPDGRVFLAMTFYEGETLKQRLARGRLSVDEAVAIVADVARAIAAAHDAGVVHRDIKPANVMLTRRGEVKLLDFGVAKLSGRTSLTRTGTTVGTIAYMAPEQLTGYGADQRSDVWSLGVVLYEAVAGRLPFSGEHEVAMISAIANAAPAPLDPGVPADVQRVIRRALERDLNARYQSAHALLGELDAIRAARGPVATTTTSIATPPARSRRWLVPAVAGVLIVAVASAFWLVARGRRVARLQQEAVPRIAALYKEERFPEAYRLLRSVEGDLAGDPELAKLRESLFFASSVRTTPPGADLYIKGYTEKADWLYLGRSPLENIKAPLGYYRWRVTKPGFVTFEGGAPVAMADITFTLAAEGAIPADMVAVPPGPTTVGGQSTAVGPFLIDRFEVTNRDYKRFLDANGYRTRQYWREPFVRDGREIPWEDGIRELRDGTGQTGPSAWELGTYPQGQDDYPVRGVSWYEASAYAAWAGRMLPTVAHWRRAASVDSVFSEILVLSNFSGKAPAAVGSYQGIGEFGTYDMAGNVKEWARNAVGAKRYILGGGWNEPNYRFREPDALAPLDRPANAGFRCITLPAGAVLDASLDREIPSISRDYSGEKPASDELFLAYRRLYDYDHTPLDAKVESTDDSSEFWRTERVSYAAAYGNERIPAYLFLPKQGKPPYETVVYFPHSGGEYLRSFEQSEMNYLGFVVQAGRALLFPMYKGTYERRFERPIELPNARRDLTIQRMKDLQRSVDYVASRTDLDATRMAYFGVSLGARLGAIALAIEKRFKTAVLWSGGFPTITRLPEVDEINFAPRVTTPVLMLNGRDDFTFPIETSQDPMFRMLGTKNADKQRVLYDGGHIFPFTRIMKDTLEWLDRYLGPVQ